MVKIHEYVEKTAVIELPVEGFENLSLKDKMIAYHLSQAAIAGDAITYLQNYKYGLQLRDLFLKIIEFKDLIRNEVYEKIEIYTKKILINHGNHDVYSTAKFIPKFSREEFDEALDIINANGNEIKIDQMLYKAIFDIDFEQMLTQKSPKQGDIITESYNTFYENVTLKDLENFEDKNPNNSSVTKENGMIIEKIWRAGNNDIKPGIYAQYLKQVCHHLEHAMQYANDEQKHHLEILKKYFEDGTAHLWDDYNISWLKSNPQVDQILGFVEEYRDSRSKKGLFEGMAFIHDKKMNEVIHKIANEAQYLENHSPWNDKYKKEWDRIPIANAISLITGCGGAGPICWAGVNLPNAQDIRVKYGSKNVVIANVTYASRTAFAEKIYNEFLESKEEIDTMLKYNMIRGPVMVTLHEIVGHGSGTSSPQLKNDPRDYLREYYGSLEEARAELCALHHIWNPKLREIGVIPNEECCKIAMLNYVLGDLTQLRTFEHEDEMHEDHYRAMHLIVQYLMQETKAVEFYKGTNGKTYPKVLDYEKMREGIAELLAELMRIKAEGDYDAIKILIDKYAIKFDLKLRDEIVARAKVINYPSAYAYIMAMPTIKKDETGKIVDVILKYPSGIIDQACSWKESGHTHHH